jgi:hypothetical protein
MANEEYYRVWITHMFCWGWHYPAYDYKNPGFCYVETGKDQFVWLRPNEFYAA